RRKWLSVSRRAATRTRIRSCHESLQSTRGAVLAIACVVDDCIRVVGVGNITALKVRGEESHFTSMNGVIGRNLKNVKVFSYPTMKVTSS
ncbi:MAG: hypothetical protein KAT13_05815, partial [Methanosarcinales archaeon]|nr:hypothetical protein [Methanosarcinales archaeon]